MQSIKNLFIYLFFYIIILTSISHSNVKEFFFSPYSQMRSIIFVEDFYRLYTQNLNGSTLSYRRQLFYLKKALIAAETDQWWIHPTRSFAYIHHQWTNSKIANNKVEYDEFDEIYYKKYKLVMKARISLLITKLLIQLGSKYDRENIYWFHKENYDYPQEDSPKKDHYLKRSFEVALFYYLDAKKYWEKTIKYCETIFQDFYLNPTTNEKVYYKNINLKGDLMDSIEDQVYQIYYQNNENYKKDIMHYFNKQNYPKYNYSKIIDTQIQRVKEKQEILNQLLAK